MKFIVIIPDNVPKTNRDAIPSPKEYIMELDADLHGANSYCDCAFNEDTYCLWIPKKLVNKGDESCST